MYITYLGPGDLTHFESHFSTANKRTSRYTLPFLISIKKLRKKRLSRNFSKPVHDCSWGEGPAFTAKYRQVIEQEGFV